VSPNAGTYVVFRQAPSGDWHVVGEIGRRPGLAARKSRAQAVRDVLGREPEAGDVYAVLPGSEWRVALDH
jgi:hypothetical protein